MITMFYAGLCTLLVLVLASRVIARRFSHKIGIGDGGDHELAKRVRTHANAVEYLPLALLLLGGMELNGYPDAVIHGFGITLLISRLLHAWGLSRSSSASPGRLAGTALTLVLMTVMALFAIAGFVQPYLAGDREAQEQVDVYGD